jgi:hypothetical protein
LPQVVYPNEISQIVCDYYSDSKQASQLLYAPKRKLSEINASENACHKKTKLNGM